MKKLEKGAKNLIILGAAAVLIALTTTSIALAIYRISGDIYLDRSRPGFLPDEEEISKDESDTPAVYAFPDSGPVTKSAVSDYRTHLESEIESIEAYDSPFSPDPLSDTALGLPTD